MKTKLQLWLNRAWHVSDHNKYKSNTSSLLADKNQKHIEYLAGQAKDATKEACDEWGIKIGGDSDNRMLRIENAEQLAPPKLEFGGVKIEPAKTGRGDYGDFDFRNRRFFKELLVEHLTTR